MRDTGCWSLVSSHWLLVSGCYSAENIAQSAERRVSDLNCISDSQRYAPCPMRFAFRNLFADTSYETSSLCRRIRGAPIVLVLVLEIEKKTTASRTSTRTSTNRRTGQIRYLQLFNKTKKFRFLSNWSLRRPAAKLKPDT